MEDGLKEIPGPHAWPFIGNYLDLREGDYPLQALERLAAKYGEIYKLTGQGRTSIYISSVRMLEELSDEDKFQKLGGGFRRSLPKAGPPGLFSAPTESEAWFVRLSRIDFSKLILVHPGLSRTGCLCPHSDR